VASFDSISGSQVLLSSVIYPPNRGVCELAGVVEQRGTKEKDTTGCVWQKTVR